MSDHQATSDKIRDYILREFLPGESAENLKDDTQLLTSGILDSMSTLKLVAYVEENFSVSVDAHEASTQFNTIGEIASLIASKA